MSTSQRQTRGRKRLEAQATQSAANTNAQPTRGSSRKTVDMHRSRDASPEQSDAVTAPESYQVYMTRKFLENEDCCMQSGDLYPLLHHIWDHGTQMTMTLPTDEEVRADQRYWLPNGLLADDWVSFFKIAPDRYLEMAPHQVREGFKEQAWDIEVNEQTFMDVINQHKEWAFYPGNILFDFVDKLPRRNAPAPKIRGLGCLRPISSDEPRSQVFGDDNEFLMLSEDMVQNSACPQKRKTPVDSDSEDDEPLIIKRPRPANVLPTNPALNNPLTGMRATIERSRVGANGQQPARSTVHIVQQPQPPVQAPQPIVPVLPQPQQLGPTPQLPVAQLPVCTATRISQPPIVQAPPVPQPPIVRAPLMPRPPVVQAAPVPPPQQAPPMPLAPAAAAVFPLLPDPTGRRAFLPNLAVPGGMATFLQGRGITHVPGSVVPDKNVSKAWSAPRIRAWVEVQGNNIYALPTVAFSQHGTEMTNLRTPASINPNCCPFFTSLHENFAYFADISTLNREMCFRAMQHYTPANAAYAQHYFHNFNNPKTVGRSKTAYRYPPAHTWAAKVPGRVPTANMPTIDTEAGLSGVDKVLHDYSLYDMGLGVFRHPTGRQRQMLTRVIEHVMNVTRDRNVRLSQAARYAAQHDITVPANEQINFGNLAVEDAPAPAFITLIKNTFAAKFPNIGI